MSARRRARPVVTIDGPAGVGKSTIARALAGRLGYRYVDSGAMYRVVGLAARARQVDPGDGAALARMLEEITFDVRDDGATQHVTLDGRDVTAAIREPVASEWASRVAVVPEVRAALVERQRAAAAAGGVVMEGRDIGTVVCPDAECKFYLTATQEERARRRQRDAGTTLAATETALAARDRRDQVRSASPLKPAPDALIVDTTELAAADVVARLLAEVRKRARP